MTLIDPGQLYQTETFRHLTDLLTHRGPDASGTFHEPGVHLGHRRLSILDLSAAANQPFSSACGRYVAVFNGEIYNYQELCLTWDLRPRTRSDTEVLVEGFVRRGSRIFECLRGMFALAIYDRSDRLLYLARDHVGIKPLFYHQSTRLFAASSELNPLLCLDEVKAAGLDQAALARYLSLGYIPAPATAYQAVQKFPPGHWGVLRDGRLKLQPYWQAGRQPGAEIVSDESEALELLEQTLSASVKEHLVSDVPFGAFLSGGTDSSLVVALAQQHSSSPIRTFCVRMHGHVRDESAYARQVARHLGSLHFEFDFHEEEALKLIPEITTVYQEPYADSSAAPTMMLARLAREHVTMALAGDGGDELFLGYGSYTWSQRLENRWIQPFRRWLAALLMHFGDRPQRLGELLEPVAQRYQAQQTFAAEQGFFTAAARRQLLSPEWKSWEGGLAYAPATSEPLAADERQALFDLAYYLPDDLLTKVDRATMRYSLEARVPLLGPRVLELAFRIDRKLKRKGGVHKYLLKKLLSRYLPDALVHRKKWGFSIPLKGWMQGPLRWMEEEYLHPRVLGELGLARPDVVADLRTRFHRGEERLYQKIWTLVILHKWFLEFSHCTPAALSSR